MFRGRFRTHIDQAAQLTSNRPLWANGLRGAIATVGPIVIASALGSQSGIWLGLAGFNVALCDKGGPGRTRFLAMLSAAIYGAIGAIAGAFAGRHVWSSVVVLAVWALASGLARTWGATATSAGIVSLATYVVSLAFPARTAVEAFERGGDIIAGSALAMFLALVVWRVRPYRAVRRAVARVYRALSHEPAVEVQKAIDAARMSLAALRRGLNAETPRGERLLILVETASRMLASGDIPPAETLDAIAEVVEKERNDGLAPRDGTDLLAIAIRAAREANEEPPSDRSGPTFRLRYIDPLLGNLTWESNILRHALRVAVATAAAEAWLALRNVPRGYWVLFSIIVVLQPYTSATVQKGLQRIVGTIAGGIMAALLLSVVQSPAEMMIIVFIGAMLTIALLPVNYGLYSFALTPTFVLLAEVGAIDRHLVWLRVENTIIGGAIAYVAAWILWPASESGRVRDDLVAALQALADYARCIGECDDEHAREARRAAELALQNGEASLQRLLSDPKSGEDAEALMTLLTYARRCERELSRIGASPNRLRQYELTENAWRALTEIAGAVAASRKPEPIAATPIAPIAALHDAASRG